MANREPTEQLVKEWLSTQQRVSDIKSDLNSAQCRMHNAENALGKRLAPGDMVDGEEIGLWVRLNSEQERLVVMRRKDPQTFTLRFRK